MFSPQIVACGFFLLPHTRFPAFYVLMCAINLHVLKILLLVLNQCAPDFDVPRFFFASSRFNGHNSLLQCWFRLITMLFPCNVYTYFQSDQINYKNTSMQFYDYRFFFTLYTLTVIWI